MPHVRQQIRDAVVTALTGLATTGTKVYATRLYPLTEANLPGLCVFTDSDSIDHIDMGSPRTQQRRMSISVEMYAKGTVGYDDALDQMALEVESAIFTAGDLGGLARDVRVTSFGSEHNGDGDQPICAGTMTIEVIYQALEGAADTAI